MWFIQLPLAPLLHIIKIYSMRCRPCYCPSCALSAHEYLWLTFMRELSTMMAPLGTMRLWSISCTESIAHHNTLVVNTRNNYPSSESLTANTFTVIGQE